MFPPIDQPAAVPDPSPNHEAGVDLYPSSPPLASMRPNPSDGQEGLYRFALASQHVNRAKAIWFTRPILLQDLPFDACAGAPAKWTYHSMITARLAGDPISNLSGDAANATFP